MTTNTSQWKPHPWHGLSVGPAPPETVNAYIEITPYDLIKYEVDKQTGCLTIDRPQRTSSLPPTLYGFIPQTYCGPRVAALSEHATRGDEDPLDICVITERPIGRSEVLATACVVGVLRGVDKNKADDKIIAILDSDPLWQDVRELEQLPPAIIKRLHHYFNTYKHMPGEVNQMSVMAEEGRESAFQIIQAAMQDYLDLFQLMKIQPIGDTLRQC